ncbi:MAG: DUF2059 domain-containing protein [Candidatus Acidiferrales bacterium]
MKHLTAVLALCFLSATGCVAQQSDADQPATKADIERYYDTMHIRDMMKNMMAAMSQQMQKMMREQLQRTPNLPANAQEKIEKTVDDSLANMPIDELLDAMEPVYAKHFTKGDIDALAAFYSTPTGKKMLTELPAMTAEAMQASQSVMAKYIQHVQEQVQDQIAQMQKDAQPDAKKATTSN